MIHQPIRWLTHACSIEFELNRIENLVELRNFIANFKPSSSEADNHRRPLEHVL